MQRVADEPGCSGRRRVSSGLRRHPGVIGRNRRWSASSRVRPESTPDTSFTTGRGTPLDAATVTRSFQRALKTAGLPHQRFHDLRHSAATFLLAQGFTLEDVKNLLGHSSIVLTSNTHRHVLEQRQRQVAMGMDAVLGG